MPAGSVQVRATEAQNRTGFPFECSILFRGSYVDGAWPQLRVPAESFGTSYAATGLGMGGCAEFSVKQTGDATLTKSNVTATIVPIGCTRRAPAATATCRSSSPRRRRRSAAPSTSTSRARSSGLPVAGHARDLEALLSELVPGVEVTKHDHADAPYGVAFAVTFPPAAGRVDQLAAGASKLTGGDATANVYPVAPVSTMADARDMAGTFRLSVGGQETGDIRWDATHGKVLAELHALDVVARAAMLGAADGALSLPVYLPNGTAAYAVAFGDASTAVAAGDPAARTPRTRGTTTRRPTRLITDVTYYPRIKDLHRFVHGNLTLGLDRLNVAAAGGVTVFGLSTPFAPSDLFRGDVQLHRVHQYDLNAGETPAEDVQGLYQAFIGVDDALARRAAGPRELRARDDRVAGVADGGPVSGGLDYSRVVYLHPGGHDLLNALVGRGGRAGLGGERHAHRHRRPDVRRGGRRRLRLRRRLPAARPQAPRRRRRGSPTVNVFPYLVTAATTADLRGALADGDDVWIGRQRYVARRVDAASLLLRGAFDVGAEGATAFGWANGYEYCMVFKDFASPLAADPGGARKLDAINTVRAGAEEPLRGTGAQLRYACPSARRRGTRSWARRPRSQTVALRCASAECAANRQGVRGNFTLSLAHSDRYLADGEAAATVTEPIAWGASEDDVRAALEKLNEVDRVDVKRTGRGDAASEFGYVYTLTFWGGRHAGATALEVDAQFMHADWVSAWMRSSNRTSIHVDTVRNGVAPGRHPPQYLAFSPDHEYRFRVRGTRRGPPSEERRATIEPTVWRTRADGGRAGRALLRDEPVAGLAPALDGGAASHGLPRRARRQQRLRRVSPAYVGSRGRLRARGPDGDDARRAPEAERRGTFTLSWGGRTTKALKYDVAAEDVADAVSKLTGVWDVGVPPVRDEPRSRAARGYTWRVFFVGVYGDVGPRADDTYLVGDDARIEVATLQDGGPCDVLGTSLYEMSRPSTSVAPRRSPSEEPITLKRSRPSRCVARSCRFREVVPGERKVAGSRPSTRSSRRTSAWRTSTRT